MPQVVRDRTVGWLAILLGAALAFCVQVLAPVGVPLYDGVAIQEPYRYLHPTGDQPGSPSSFSSTPQVDGSTSPELQAFTAEQPPQVQLVMLSDALVLTPGATSLKVGIAPIEPPAVAAGGVIAGNVYRISVTDQSGTPLAIRPCAGCISLVMRGPEGIGDARLQRFADGAWTDVDTIHAGVLGQYATNPKAFGDYAVVAGGPGGGGEEGDTGALLQTFLVAGGAGVILLLIVAAVLLRRRQEPAPVAPRPRPIPSKRKRPPKPPTGRSDR